MSSFQTPVCTFRSIPLTTENSFAFKQSPNSPYPTIDDWVYIKNDFDLSRACRSQAILKSTRVGQEKDRLYIEKEYFPGIQLSQYVKENSLSVSDFLILAIKLTKTLQEIHKDKIIVKEYIIENFLINPSSKEIKFCSLGASSQLEREVIDHNSTIKYHGSLWHISPEQTGRLSRTVDHRTDFYSLGVLFYELLTGKKPFDYSDTIDLIHAHIAKAPTPPHVINQIIPECLSQIILKLMAKNPENRYQSENGIINDLETCWQSWKKTGHIPNFTLAREDSTNTLYLSEMLYGRSKEFASLCDIWKKTKNERAQLYLVSGYSGIGKTRLINEIKGPVLESNGMFLSGKSDQLNKDIPYSGFIQIFSKLIQELLSEPADRIALWRKVIEETTQDSISFLGDIIPNLELITGNSIESYNIGPIEGKKKFNKAILDFLKIFEVLDRPIVIFHDDLQWADLDSLELIKTILDGDLKNILILGAYRDNEVDSLHPLAQLISTIESDNPEILFHTSLAGLQLEDVNQFIADSFRVSPLTTKELTKRIVDKTGGNPFFVKQLLQELVNESIITYDFDLNGWLWNLDEIGKLAISDSVVDILLKRMKSLPPRIQNVLKAAACIGNTFDTNTLIQISTTSTDELSEDLWTLISEQYVNPVGYWKKHHIQSNEVVSPQNHTFKFQHDRIQQASYSLIPVQKQTADHYRIGKILLSRYEQDETHTNSFDVLNHFMLGRDHIVSEDEKMVLAKIANTAGRKAYMSNIIRQAVLFFQFGFDLLGSMTDNDVFKELLIGRSECEYLLGNYDESERLFDEAIQNATSEYDKADILCRKMALYENTQRHSKAIEAARQGLKSLGIDLPNPVTQDHVISELTEVQNLLKSTSTSELIKKEPITSPEIRLAMKILMNLFGPAYLLADQQLLGFKILRMVRYSILHGNSIESALAYSLYGYVISAQMQAYKEGCDYAHLGMRLNRQLNDKTLRAKVFVIGAGCVAFWGDEYKKQIKLLVEAFESGITHNDIIWAGYSTTHITRALIMSGENLSSTYRQLEKYLNFTQKVDAQISRQQILTWMRYVSNMLTAPIDSKLFKDQVSFEDHLSSIQKMNEEHGLALPLANFYSAQALFYYILNDNQHAYKYSILADDHMIAVAGLMEWPEQRVIKLLTQAALLREKVKLSKAEQHQIDENRALLESWAQSSPKNFLVKKHLVDAEFYDIQGDFIKAEKSYLTAVSCSDLTHFKAISCERLADHYIRQDQSELALGYYQRSLLEYHNYGAARKIDELSAKIKLYDTGQADSLKLDSRTDFNLDRESLLLAAQSLSGEVTLEGLMSKLFRILVQNAGAQNAYFIRRRDNDMVVEYASLLNDNNEIRKVDRGIDDMEDMPSSIIRRVYLTQSHKLVNDVQKGASESSELRKLHAESLLCLPIISQGQTKAVIYLDNHISKHVFDPNKMQLLNLLSGQIAVSLENAELYEGLESRVKKRTEIIEKQKEDLEASNKKSEDLLLNILPRQIARELKQNGQCKSRRYNSVTIMFTDFEGFTKMSQELKPEEIVKFLDFHFTVFDKIIEKYGLEKIKTIGDSYMCVGGIPESDPDHARKTVEAAIEISQFVNSVIAERMTTGLPYTRMRIGIHTGSVIAGVVGYKKFAYDIWGDAVNIASSMEANCEPGKVNISENTYEMIRSHFDCVPRGNINAKNRGNIEMYYVNTKVPMTQG